MIKRVIALILTVLVVFVLIKLINIQAFLEALSHPRWPDLIAALLFFIPLVGITAFRWQILVHKSCHCSLWESVKLQLASNTLNLILPSKLGDLSKGYFLRNTGKVDLSRGMNIVIFEKLIDLSSLGIVYLTGLCFHGYFAKADYICLGLIVFFIVATAAIYFIPLRIIPGYTALLAWLEGRGKLLSKIGYFLEDGQKLIFAIRENNLQIISIVALSILLWFLHMTQVYFFFHTVGALPNLMTVFHWAPMAILVGLIPVTISGIGIRDGSFMFLFRSYGSQAVLFAASVLITLRYIIPGVLGLFFINQYLVRNTVKQK
ncbi:MAG: flippase-like domain-containing protein [Candidatus Omnitrophica bacterium]|nr:flippase-like domain-containing protein [Candidatus Omnitrophota bacterium]